MLGRDLPQVPLRPHAFFDLPEKDVEVRLKRPVRVRYREVGTGQPLLLVHGLMTSGYSWRYVIESLATKRRVIVPDLIGAGNSAKPLWFDYTLDATAEFLGAFLEALHVGSADVVGNSLGGLIALRLASLRPQAVRRLVVIHAPAFPMLKTRLLAWLLRRGFAERLLVRHTRRRAMSFVRKNVRYARRDVLSWEEVREYAKVFASVEGAQAFVRILCNTMDPRALPPPRVEAPTLLVWADADELIPARFGPRLAAYLGGAPLVVMKGVSHFCHVEAPEETVARIDEFLASPAPRRVEAGPGARA